MRWSLQVARVAGIPIRIHASFLLLVAWVAFVYYEQNPTPASVGRGVLFLLVVFALIVAHELSHALVARAFGVRTRDITLWPIGGISNLERMPENPLQELLIAVAGPLLNLVIALGLGAYVVRAEGWRPLLDPRFGGEGFLVSLVWVNAILALFNLLPAFPMDGGRALRAFLAMFTDRVTATRMAVVVGKGMAVLFVLVGLLGNVFLALIGVLVWMGASAEGGHTELKATLAGYPVTYAMLGSFERLDPDARLTEAMALRLSRGQRVFPVFSEGRVAGALSELGLLRGLARGGRDERVATFMSRDLPVLPPSAPLVAAFELLEERRVCCVLIEEEERLLGIVTLGGISAFLSLMAALHGELPAGSAAEEPSPPEPVGSRGGV